MSRLEKYPNYKDSGVEWIGEIPEHWKITKLGLCLTPVSIKNRSDLLLLSVVREKGIILRDIEDQDSNHNFIPDDLSNYKMVKKGQFAMNKMKAWQGSYGVSDHTGIVSPAYYVFKLQHVKPDFFHLAIRSKSTYVPFFVQASDGVRIGQWDLSKTRMKEIPFYLPTEEEQDKIVKYIRDSNKKIDQAITLKEQLIEKLKERRQVLINDAITKGLDPNVKMKDSGVEWIGEIPEHWEVKKLKYVLLLQNEKTTITSEKVVALENLESKTGMFIETNSKYEGEGVVFKKGNILFGKLRPYLAKVYHCKESGIAFGDLLVYKPLNINSLFAFYFMLSNNFIQIVDGSTYGTKMPRASSDFINNLLFPLPPLQEQKQIVDFIENQTSKIDNAINLQQKQIVKLKEYKTTLIDSVVTGKVRVS